MNEEQFLQTLKEKGISLSPEQVKQFEIYFDTLVEWNNKINLTALTAKEDVYLKHFYDSITPAFYYDFNDNLHICDIGAGAGFPSIPLKICFPNLKVIIFDYLKKKIGFLNFLSSHIYIIILSFYHTQY